MQTLPGGHLSVFQTPSRLPFLASVGALRGLPLLLIRVCSGLSWSHSIPHPSPSHLVHGVAAGYTRNLIHR